MMRRAVQAMVGPLLMLAWAVLPLLPVVSYGISWLVGLNGGR
jgi:hypothetical protein